MIKRFPLLFRFLLFVAFPLLLIILFCYRHLESTIAATEGDFHVSGLRSSVQITHDKYGTPNIVAANDHDAFFTLGYKHASDRLWQLEIQRRLVQGRLSEILGPKTLQSDIWMRTLGLEDAAKRSIKYLDPESIAVLNAYADGINAWIDQVDVLPLEFQAFGIKPEPWSIYDTLGWQKYFALNLNGNMFDEMRRLVLQQHFSSKQINYFYPFDPIESLANNASSSPKNLIVSREMMNLFGAGYKYAGSNAWVVSGKHTQSGHPIIANDPHLGLQLPGLWYAAKLKGDKLDVAGMTLVGMPVVVFGQNANIAWGGTNLMSDQQDLFVETTSSDHPNQYLNGEEWKPFNVRHETIKISAHFPSALREPLMPIKILVRQTDRGPIVSDVHSVGDDVMSLRWAALDSDDITLESFIKLQYANNWSDFRGALSVLKAPGLNFVYADRQGNIGYQAAGMMPNRAKGIGILPQRAADDSGWQGYHDFEQLPSIFNPDKGFIVTANEKLSHGKEIVISYDWAPSARHERITGLINQFLESGKQMTVDDMKIIQLDQKDFSSLELLHYLQGVIPDSAETEEAIGLLKKWDGDFKPDSVGAALFVTWSHYLEREIFDDILKNSWQRPEIEAILASAVDELTWPQLAKVLASNEHGWCEKQQSHICLKELQVSLGRALRTVEKITGTGDISKWHWGVIHHMEMRHQPFGNVKGLEKFFKRTAHIGGSPNSVNAANIKFDYIEGFVQDFGAGFRQVFQLDDSRSHWYMLSTGQSGIFMSAHFDDMIDPFLTGHLAIFPSATQTSDALRLSPGTLKK